MGVEVGGEVTSGPSPNDGEDNGNDNKKGKKQLSPTECKRCKGSNYDGSSSEDGSSGYGMEMQFSSTLSLGGTQEAGAGPSALK